MATDTRNKRAAEPVPQTREEAETLLASIGANERRLASAKANRDDEIEETKNLYEQRMKPLEERLDRERDALHRYCEAHRVDLTQNGKRKSVQFKFGKVAWRVRPPSVSLKKPKDVLDRLLAIRSKPFVRTTYAIDKEAMLARPERAEEIEGVTIQREREDFVITPNKTPEPTAETKKEDAA